MPLHLYNKDTATMALYILHSHNIVCLQNVYRNGHMT